MSTKQQQRRVKKLNKRKQVSKQKQRAKNIQDAYLRQDFGKGYQGEALSKDALYDKVRGENKAFSVRDLINNRQRLAELAEQMKLTGDEDIPQLFSGEELLNAINDMITVTIKLHSGVIVYNRLVEERRFDISEDHRALLENYERKVVEFAEDVSVVTTLHEAGQQPEDYFEVVLNLADVMAVLSEEFGEPVLALITKRGDLIEAYAVEHKPEGLSVYDYMCQLHSERITVIQQLYGESRLNDVFNELRTLEQELPDSPGEIPGDNLPFPEKEEVGEFIAISNDPVINPQ